MLMRDHPLVVNPAVTDSRPPPHIEFLSVSLRRADVVESVGEGDVTARRDVQVANLEANWALERREPLLRSFSKRIRSDILQWVYYVKRPDVRRDVGHSPVNVLSADCLYSIIY